MSMNPGNGSFLGKTIVIGVVHCPCYVRAEAEGPSKSGRGEGINGLYPSNVGTEYTRTWLVSHAGPAETRYLRYVEF